MEKTKIEVTVEHENHYGYETTKYYITLEETCWCCHGNKFDSKGDDCETLLEFLKRHWRKTKPVLNY